MCAQQKSELTTLAELSGIGGFLLYASVTIGPFIIWTPPQQPKREDARPVSPQESPAVVKSPKEPSPQPTPAAATADRQHAQESLEQHVARLNRERASHRSSPPTPPSDSKIAKVTPVAPAVPETKKPDEPLSYPVAKTYPVQIKPPSYRELKDAIHNIPCPHCGHTEQRSGEWVAKHGRIKSSCGSTFSIEDYRDSVRQQLEDAHEREKPQKDRRLHASSR